MIGTKEDRNRDTNIYKRKSAQTFKEIEIKIGLTQTYKNRTKHIKQRELYN
jgi:hypothetical protein